jgi:hypothetical protein
MKAPTVQTRARVQVVLDVDIGGDSWRPEEPGLGRAFNEARTKTLNILERVLRGEGTQATRNMVRIDRVGGITLVVTQDGLDEEYGWDSRKGDGA